MQQHFHITDQQQRTETLTRKGQAPKQWLKNDRFNGKIKATYMVKTFSHFWFKFLQLTQHLREKKVEFGARQRK